MAFFQIPSNLSTKLAAVNILLQAIGEHPVDTLDGGTSSADAVGAEQALDEHSRAAQARGWHFNSEENMQLFPDTSGEIKLPSNTIALDAAYWRPYQETSDITQRGDRLYNRAKHTFIFEDPVYVDLVIHLPWEQLPEYARQAIIYKAVYAYQMHELTSTAISRVDEALMQSSWATLESREDLARPNNQLSGNIGHNSLYGRTPRRRSS